MAMQNCKHAMLEWHPDGHRCVDCDKQFKIDHEPEEPEKREWLPAILSRLQKPNLAATGGILKPVGIIGAIAAVLWLANFGWSKRTTIGSYIADAFTSEEKVENSPVVTETKPEPEQPKVKIVEKIVPKIIKAPPVVKYIEKPVYKVVEKPMFTNCSPKDVMRGLIAVKKEDWDKVVGDYKLERESWENEAFLDTEKDHQPEDAQDYEMDDTDDSGVDVSMRGWE